jgi:hypothetical protein
MNGIARLITFKVRTTQPLNRSNAQTLKHTHTHTLSPSILPLLETLAEGFSFLYLPDFSRRIRFTVLKGWEKCPLAAHFQSREDPKVTRSEVRRLRWLGTSSDVWLGALSWCWNRCPCHLSRFLRTASKTVKAVRTHGAPNNRCQIIPGTF